MRKMRHKAARQLLKKVHSEARMEAQVVSAQSPGSWLTSHFKREDGGQMRMSLFGGTLSLRSLWKIQVALPSRQAEVWVRCWAGGWARGTALGGISVFSGDALGLGEHRKSLFLRTVLGNTII